MFSTFDSIFTSIYISKQCVHHFPLNGRKSLLLYVISFQISQQNIFMLSLVVWHIHHFICNPRTQTQNMIWGMIADSRVLFTRKDTLKRSLYRNLQNNIGETELTAGNSSALVYRPAFGNIPWNFTKILTPVAQTFLQPDNCQFLEQTPSDCDRRPQHRYLQDQT